MEDSNSPAAALSQLSLSLLSLAFLSFFLLCLIEGFEDVLEDYVLTARARVEPPPSNSVPASPSASFHSSSSASPARSSASSTEASSARGVGFDSGRLQAQAPVTEAMIQVARKAIWSLCNTLASELLKDEYADAAASTSLPPSWVFLFYCFFFHFILKSLTPLLFPFPSQTSIGKRTQARIMERWCPSCIRFWIAACAELRLRSIAP
jgi:hypothetical protein